MAVLKEGVKAPAFKALDQDGKTIALKDFLGKKIVLYFYPKDDTPGCTAQACNLKENYNELIELGFQVIGVSVDGVKSHKKFQEKYELPFPLVSDEEKKIVDSYNLWGEKKFMGKTYMGTTRTTFLIDETGKIKKIIAKPDTKNHTAEIIAAWNED